MLWLKQHRPKILNATATTLHCKDWLYYQLTGDLATDPSEGVFTFGNFRTRQYDNEVLGILGLSEQRNLLPEIVDGTKHSGTLDKEAAVACGLLAGTPVVLGYVDVVCCHDSRCLYRSLQLNGRLCQAMGGTVYGRALCAAHQHGTGHHASDLVSIVRDPDKYCDSAQSKHR